MTQIDPMGHLLHYCFFSLGSWEGNASLVRPRELGAEFLKRGHRVSFLLDDVPYNRQKVNLPAGANIEFVSPTRGLGQFAARRKILRRLNADYVHILDPSPKSYLTLRLMPSQKQVVDWDEWSTYWPLSWFRRTRSRLIDRWHRGQASLLVVASRYMQEQFQARFGVHPLYVPYATYLEEKPSLPSPFTEPTAVYMGNFVPGYDHNLIFHAAVLLKARGVQPRIEFLGQGPELEQWRRFVAEKGLDRVDIKGFVTGDDLWARLRHAHVLMFPIRPGIVNLARCPSKTYAYAQARRPVITCRVGEVPGVLGDKAIYVDPTPEAFAEAIDTAMRQPQPDMDYGIEQHNWGARAETLLAALLKQ